MSTLEYEDIYHDNINTIQKSEYDDLYTEIMTQEKIREDTLNRLERLNRQVNETNRTLLNSTIDNVVYRTFKVVTSVVMDMMNRESLNKVFSPERRLYLGLFITFLSVCFIILYKV